MKALNVALAVAGGVAFGAALGLLLAPKSGKDTREDIKSFIRSKCPLMKESKLDRLVDKIRTELDEVEK